MSETEGTCRGLFLCPSFFGPSVTARCGALRDVPIDARADLRVQHRERSVRRDMIEREDCHGKAI